ncbi:hypothetical protein [Vibrio parahaemolyticus]
MNRIILYVNIALTMVATIAISQVFLNSILNEESIVDSELYYISNKINTIPYEEKHKEIQAILESSILSKSGYYLEFRQKDHPLIRINPDKLPAQSTSSFKNFIDKIFGRNLTKSYRVNNSSTIYVNGKLLDITFSKFFLSSNQLPFLLIAVWYAIFSIYSAIAYRDAVNYIHNAKNSLIKGLPIRTSRRHISYNIFNEIEGYIDEIKEKHKCNIDYIKLSSKNEIINLHNQNDEINNQLDHMILEASSLASSQKKLINNLMMMTEELKGRTTDKDSTLTIIQMERMLNSLMSNNNNFIDAHDILRKEFEPIAQDFFYLSDECCISINTIADLNNIDIFYVEQTDIPTELFINSAIFRDTLLEMVEHEAASSFTKSINVSVSYVDSQDSHLLIEVNTCFNGAGLVTYTRNHQPGFSNLQKSLKAIGGNLKCKFITDHNQNNLTVEIPAIQTGNESSLYKSTLLKLSDKQTNILVIDTNPSTTFILTSKLRKLLFTYKKVSSIQRAKELNQEFDVVFVIDAENNQSLISQSREIASLIVGIENTYSQSKLDEIQRRTDIDVALPLNIPYGRLTNCLMKCAEYCCTTIKNKRVLNEFIATESLLHKLSSDNNSFQVTGKPTFALNTSVVESVRSRKSVVSGKHVLVYSSDHEDMGQMSQVLSSMGATCTSTTNYNELYSFAISSDVDCIFICLHSPLKEEYDVIYKLKRTLSGEKPSFYLLGAQIPSIQDVEFLNIFRSILIYPITQDKVTKALSQ